jgi:hypothetical protein
LRVLRRLGCFLLPLVLFWGVLEVGMSRVPNIFSVKHDRCLALAPELDTIVVGSSNAFSGINPAFLSGSAFNLCVPSQTHYYDERISRIAMAHLPHLKRIIVCVTYVSLFWQAYESPEAWRQYYFRQEWGIPPVRPEDRWNIKNWSRVALDSPETSFNQLCKGFRKSRAREVDPRGWNTSLTQGKPKDLLDPAAALRVAGHDALASPANVPANLGYLESLIAQAQARNIEVVLVTLPVWPTYRAHIRQDYWNQTRTAMEALAARHHIRYLNFFQYPGMSAEDYYDSDHLSAAGGIHFTQLLDTSLNSPPDQGERP